MERDAVLSTLVAVRPGGWELFDDGGGVGHIERGGEVFEPGPLIALFARGYWGEPVRKHGDGSHDEADHGNWARGAFVAEPVERLTALGGAFEEWKTQGLFEKSSDQLAALGDDRLNLTGHAGTIGTGDAVAARWQGTHLDLTAKAWDESEPDTREFLVAHEVSHAAAADFLANLPQDVRDGMLEPFRNTPGGSTYSERALVFPGESDDLARGPEEMLSDIGAALLVHGASVLQDRFENEKQFDIGAKPPDPRLIAVYDTMAEALARVGNPPPGYVIAEPPSPPPSAAFTKHTPGGVDHDQSSHGNWAHGRTGTPVAGEDYTEAKPGSRATWAHPINHGPGPVMSIAEATNWALNSSLPGAWYHGGTRPGGAIIEAAPRAGGMDIFGRGYYVTRNLDAANDYGTVTKEVYLNVDKVLIVGTPEWESLRAQLPTLGLPDNVDEGTGMQILAQREGYQAFGNKNLSTVAVWDASRVAVVREDMRKNAPTLSDVHTPRPLSGYGAPDPKPKKKERIPFGRKKRRRGR